MKRLIYFLALTAVFVPTALSAQSVALPGGDVIVLPPQELIIPETEGTMGGVFSINNPEQKRSVDLLNIETPFRCQTDPLNNQKVISSVRLDPDDFKLTYIDTMDELPRYEVNGYSFDDTALDEALQNLVDEAGIEVFSEDEGFASLNAKDIYGELSIVVDELTKAGDVYYKYDAAQKHLHLMRIGKFEAKLPNNRYVILGILDALRGAGIENVNPNWNTGVITLNLKRDEEKRVRDLFKQILANGQLIVADTEIFTVSFGNTGGNWGEILRTFGADKIYTSNNGLMGKLLSMGHQTNPNALMESVKKYYQVTPVSHGIAIVPDNWKMRFDIGKCAANVYMQNQLSLLVYPQTRKDGSIDIQITLDSKKGEMSTFQVNAAVDNELALIGIPDGTQPNTELLAVMKLKLIRFIGGK